MTRKIPFFSRITIFVFSAGLASLSAVGCGGVMEEISSATELADCITEATHLKRCREAGESDNPLCVEHAMKTSSCENKGIITYSKIASH